MSSRRRDKTEDVTNLNSFSHRYMIPLPFEEPMWTPSNNERSAVPFISHYLSSSHTTASPNPLGQRPLSVQTADSFVSNISYPQSPCSSTSGVSHAGVVGGSMELVATNNALGAIPREETESPISFRTAGRDLMKRINDALLPEQMIQDSMLGLGQPPSPHSQTSEMSCETELEYNENNDFAMAAGIVFCRTRSCNEIVPTPVHMNEQNPEISFSNSEVTPSTHSGSATIPDSTHDIDPLYTFKKHPQTQTPLSEHPNQSPQKLIKPTPLHLQTPIHLKIQPPPSAMSADEAKIRLLAGKIAPEWRGEFMAPDLARRLRDFQFAQEKRRKKYGDERPWGILGLYDHLAAIRVDVEWAEEAAWRRTRNMPYMSWSTFNEHKHSSFNKQPFFTYLLLLACTAMLITSFGVNNWLIEPLSINPMIGPSAATLIQLGAKDSYRIVHYQEVWRLGTTMFLHAGAIHYFFNMMALFFIGTAVEKCHGFLVALIVFVIPAVGGALLSAIFLPTYISVGASGGIFGLIGACLADIVMNWNLLFSDVVNEGKKKRHAFIILMLFLDILVNCLIGMTPFVDNFTHLGGMVFGFLCGLSTLERLSSDFFGLEESLCAKIRYITIRCLGLLISLFFIGGATFLLMKGDGQTTPCASCRYLSCIPFPPWGAANDPKWWYCDDCGSITANARLNSVIGIYDEVELSCPDSEQVMIDLRYANTSDEMWIEENLEKLCRSNCQGKYKT